jgi:hypothetical protein
MLAKIYSAAVYGVDAYGTLIEVNGARGDPNIVILGLFYPTARLSIKKGSLADPSAPS